MQIKTGLMKKKVKICGIVETTTIKPVYVQILEPSQNKITKTLNLDGKGQVLVDYDRDGRVVGVEII